MDIPKKIEGILKKLEKNGYKAYLVGGCVRDLLMGNPPAGGPKDWDITTDASPEETQKIFPDNFMNNKFGTVTVLGSVEITPFRTETKYTDKRHPDKVEWAKTIEEDLSRRDFTINSIAIKIQNSEFKIIDLFDGKEDIKKGIVKAVGDANERFNEDALRMMRAVRFASVLDFTIDKKTADAIKKNAPWMKAISKERIRDELLKIIMSDNASDGIEMLRELGLLKYIIPELEDGYKVAQSKHHTYDVYKHSILSLKYAAQKNFSRDVRIASLLHDVGKPKSKRGSGESATFYGHEVVGARMSKQILGRLRFSKKEIEKITKLIRYHLFYYNVDEVTEASVRKLVRKVGPESIEELLQVRMADRIGSGVPKAEPYKLRHMKYIIEKASRDPVSVKMLKINGQDIMRILDVKPDPKIGQVLDILLGYVLIDPKNNKKAYLEKEIKKLGKLSDRELSSLTENSRKEREEVIMKEDKMTKQKYWVT
ncbi:HD domain-containing protein [Patescibacteria group bacterium]|nr:HD domain-containing protein [Patescibacteria group bacterium]